MVELDIQEFINVHKLPVYRDLNSENIDLVFR